MKDRESRQRAGQVYEWINEIRYNDSWTTSKYILYITGAAVTWAPGWLSVLARWESLLPGSAEPLVTMTVLASGDRLWHSYVSFSSVGSQGFVASRQNLRGLRARRLFVVFFVDCLVVIEGGLQKGATTLPDCRGYLGVDYGGNSQGSKLDCIGKLSALIYAQGI